MRLENIENWVEKSWKGRTPGSIEVPEGFDSQQLADRIAVQLDRWSIAALRQGSEMGCCVLDAAGDYPERLNIYRVKRSYDS